MVENWGILDKVGKLFYTHSSVYHMLNKRVKRFERKSGMNEGTKTILERIKKELKPPTDEELTRVKAKWLFGRRAEKMMKYAPWSFVLMKLFWKKGEEPWES